MPLDTVARIAKIEEETVSNNKLTLVYALNYGGRDEIVEAVNKLLSEKKQSVTKEAFAEYLWTKDMPDPDMIIRTSGEHRLSNFLPWQSVYSELFFPDFYFPDFTKEKLEELLAEYAARHRRFGK